MCEVQLLLCVCVLLLQKVSALVLIAHFVLQVESSAFGMYALIFSIVSLVQVLLEKVMLAMSATRLESGGPAHARSDDHSSPSSRPGDEARPASREPMSAADRTEAAAVRRASEEASLDIMKEHLQDFLRSNGPDVSFKAWIALLHPENVRLDSRMDSVDSWHLRLWNEVRDARLANAGGETQDAGGVEAVEGGMEEGSPVAPVDEDGESHAAESAALEAPTPTRVELEPAASGLASGDESDTSESRRV